MNRKVILMILDGWGLATNPEVSAIDKANTPFMDSLYQKYSWGKLNASGLSVGLPEVGHMNLGAGRVVYQDLVKINKAVEEKTLDNNQVLLDAFTYARENNKKVHLIGLVSDGGVHSHILHIKGLVNVAKDNGVNDVFVHALTDGRDCDPKSGYGFLKELQEHLDATTGKIATVIGRYYGMDRDKRWERVKIAYDALVSGTGKQTQDIFASVEESYAENVTDEFIKPIIHVDEQGEPLTKIEADDVVIGFNFRTDRLREITIALTQQDFPDHGMKTMPLYYVTMAKYDETFKDVKILYEKENLVNTLGEVLEQVGKKQIRIAETEKYPHVTFFFSGGREEEFKGEKRILCPSPKVATYDLKPEMSAYEVRDKIIPELDTQEADFVCLNFANADMVGHTGFMDAAMKACETVDECVKDVVGAALKNDYTTIIIADHGNSDYLVNDDGTPNTAHSTNQVPNIIVDKEFRGEVKEGVLGDLAPTILKLMGLEIPEEMTGKVLI